MNQVVPWTKLCALIEPHYPKAGNGRRPKELEQMLRIYFVQQWLNLSDPAVEEALYDSLSLRDFAGIDLGPEPVPDDDRRVELPPPAGGAQPGRGDVGDGEPPPAVEGVRITRGTIVDATVRVSLKFHEQ